MAKSTAETARHSCVIYYTGTRESSCFADGLYAFSHLRLQDSYVGIVQCVYINAGSFYLEWEFIIFVRHYTCVSVCAHVKYGGRERF